MKQDEYVQPTGLLATTIENTARSEEDDNDVTAPPLLLFAAVNSHICPNTLFINQNIAWYRCTFFILKESSLYLDIFFNHSNLEKNIQVLSSEQS